MNRPGEFAVCPVGSFPADRSAIGCLDMAGNVSEWCDEFADPEETRPRYCGGNHTDGVADHYKVTWKSHAGLTETHRWLGFRGIVRVYLKE